MSNSVIDFKGKILVVPVVSTGNVSQLAADLLIASLQLKRVSVLNPEHLIPVVGARENGETGVTTPLELFGSSDSGVFVVQQRAPALKVSRLITSLDGINVSYRKDQKEAFVEYLLGFIQESGFGAVLFLSGVSPTNRSDAQMLTPVYHIIPQNTPELTSSALKHLTQLPIPAYTFLANQDSLAEGVIGVEDPIPFIPGGGLTRRILQSLPDDWTIPTAALLQFVMEGDNRGDARHFAAVTSKVVGVEIGLWREPGSWKQGLFGKPHDQSLYG